MFHNAKRLDDGTWTWRYDSIRTGEGFEGLWDDVPRLTTPTTLIRGARSFFVNDDDAAEFARTAPGFRRVHIVEDSGHSVQSDQRACSSSCYAVSSRTEPAVLRRRQTSTSRPIAASAEFCGITTR